MSSFFSQNTDKVSCPACRAENMAYAAFCIECGTPLEETISSTSLVGSAEDNPKTALHLETQPAPGIAQVLLLRWETLLGAVLTLVLLGYVLYDWDRNTVRSDAYRSANLAAQTRDWDSALQGFTKADDLRDAATRAADARRKVNERDRSYVDARQMVAGKKWREAIVKLRQVETIQPEYRDTATLLAQATGAAFQEGLDGLVYLVDRGSNSGLYIRDAQGTTMRLPGSDKYSLLRAVSADGHRLVYDVSDERATTLVSESDSTALSTGREGPRRVQVLGTVAVDRNISITVAPQLDGRGYGVFCEDGTNGLWWYSSQAAPDAFGYEVSYYGPSPGLASKVPVDVQESHTIVRVSDLQDGKSVLALDPQGGRTILAQVEGDARGPNRRTRLYLASATGGDMHLLLSAPGEVHQAQVSPNGAWLLFTTQENADNITRSVWLLPLVTVPAVIAPRLLDTLSWGGKEMGGWLTATFVQGRDGTVRVLVSRISGTEDRLAMFDPIRPTVVYAISRKPEGAYRPDLLAVSSNGQYLAQRRQSNTGGSLELISLPLGSSTSQEAKLYALDTQIVYTRFTPGDNYLLATVLNPDGINRGTTQAIYVAAAGKGQALEQPRLLATANLPYNSDMPAIALPGDGTLLAYVSSGEQLMAADIEGSGATVIASDVRAVWSLHARGDTPWWR